MKFLRVPGVLSLLPGAALCAVFAPVRVHAQTPIPAALAAICPDSALYPNANGPRGSFQRPWQMDYPVLIFNARDGKRYWLDYGNPAPAPVEITSTFTPVTYTTEKVLLRVCGLHFNATAGVVPSTTAVPDPGQEVEGASPMIAMSASAKVAIPDNIFNFGSALPAVTGVVTTCGLSPTEITDREDAFDRAKADVDDVLRKQGIDSGEELQRLLTLEQDLFAVQIDELQDQSAYNPTVYKRTLGALPLFQQRLKTFIDLFNGVATGEGAPPGRGAAAGENFAATWQRLAEADSNLQAVMACSGNRIADSDRDDAFRMLAGVPQRLADAQDTLRTLFQGANDLYLRSSVSTYLPLPPVSVNSLTQVSITVTDPWVPLDLPKKVKIAQVGAAAATPPTDPKVTIDRTVPGKTVITVSPGSGGSASSSSPATTVTAGAGSDAVSVQIASNGAPAASAKAADSKTPAASGLSDASVLMERHRIIRFVPSAGFLATVATTQSYALETLPGTTTTTTVMTFFPSTGVSPTAPSVMTNVVATTAGFAYASPNGPVQQTAVAGLTWYPLGRDTYSVTRVGRNGRPSTETYAAHTFSAKLGMFMGTSVASLGPFVLGPTFEFKPGIQFFAGLSLQSNTKLAQNVLPCSTIGNSSPVTTQNSSNGSAPGGTTNTVVTVTSITGCATPGATVISGTTVPTYTQLKPAFSFGILLNSNLSKYFNALK